MSHTNKNTNKLGKRNEKETKYFFCKKGGQTYEAQRLTTRLKGLSDSFTYTADSNWRSDLLLEALPELLYVIKECADDLLELFENEFEREIE